MRTCAKVLAGLALAGLLASCAKPAAEEPGGRATESSAEPTSTSGAEKAQELEQKADEYRNRFDEIQASDMTPEQKAQAAGELVQEQQRTVQEAQDGADSASEPPN